MHTRKRKAVLSSAVALFLSISLSFMPGCSKSKNSLSPETWGEGILDRYLGQDEARQYGDAMRERHKLAVGEKGMIAGTTGGAAVHAGILALERGGSAVDAAMMTALTQICLAGGAWVSYAGFMQMMYYDAATGEIHNMNAAFNTVQNETEPATIPMGPPGNDPHPDGRTALVPGFLAGVEAAHQRWGKLPFETIFEPAIYLAEKGFPVGDLLAGMIQNKKEVLSRLPETKEIFVKTNGEFYAKGDIFVQPKLAKTLRRCARQGIQPFIYEGEWAEKFVAAVQRDGGKITMDDMRNYKVMWAAPISTTYGDHEIYTVGLPAYGGVDVLQGLNLMELTGVRSYGHYTESPDALFWLIQSATAFRTRSFWAMESKEVPGVDLRLPSRYKRSTAEALWQAAQNGKIPWALMPKGKPSAHSDGIVAIDQWGNLVAMTHTINTGTWGNTGINVGGISIPDSAKFQQVQIANAGPGMRLPDPTSPLIVMRGSKPVIAIGSIGSGLHYKTLCVLTSMLDFGMNPKEAIDIGCLMDSFSAAGNLQAIGKGEFEPEIIEDVRKMGQSFRIDHEQRMGLGRGYLVVIFIDPETGRIEGACPGEFFGGAEGY
ncbi:MAG: gamma-glutamyltransferase [Candidatus Aminicenantes bacterium]|nr:gamma-glutamyltransferase [Candidatus Aminicenantes bacterium]